MKLSARPAGVLLLVAGLSACDVPTGIPRWETTWITPGEETTVSVVELLPAGLAVNPDTSAFVLTIDPVNVTWQISEFCSTCTPVPAVVPKPAFTATVSTMAPLPGAVESATIASGAVDIVLTNAFNFDPLRPGAAADSGSIRITIRSGATTVASVFIDGATTSFPPYTTLNRTLEFVPSTISEDLTIELTLDSPAGDVTPMSPDDAIEFSLSSDGILVSEASVTIASQSITGTESELNLEDVDLESIKDGTIFLDIENPFGVTGDLTITVDPENGAPIVKPVTLSAGTSTAQVDFSESEMSQLIGSASELTVSGSVDGGNVTVAPDMAISVTTRLRVTIEVGGSDDDDEDA